MNKKKLTKYLMSCIYVRDGQDRVSIAKLKLVINTLNKTKIYTDNETKIKRKTK